MAKATDSNDEDIDVTGAERYIVHFAVEGVTPLLMHSFTKDQVEKILIRGERPEKDKTAPLRRMAEDGLYRDPKGMIALPQEVLFAACREAGRQVKLSGRTAVSTASTTKMPSVIRFLDSWYPITPDNWEPDVRRGQLQSGASKVAVGIVRPCFEEWGFEGKMEVTVAGGFTVAKAFDLLQIAGQSVGVGSFRPQCNGRFGCYQLTKFDYELAGKSGAASFESLARDKTAAAQ